MRRFAPFLTVAALIGATLVGAPAAVATDEYSVQNLHFKVSVGPADDHVYDVVGDVYVPTGASAAHPVPAILTTNGFGGSKDDQAEFAAYYAAHGYVVLTYSGLGFSGSDGQITLDHPDWDGKAASQLVDYLAGAAGVAYLDDAHTQPAPVLDAVKLDAPGDPRFGTIGESYGGGAQFALAMRESRVDALVPIITWNDLPYSLDPNNTALTSGVTASTPGATKLNWGAGFFAKGVTNGLQNVLTDPLRVAGCPNFALWVCPALVEATATGFLSPQYVALMRESSIGAHIAAIKDPVLLIQGQNDTLFNLNEAAATYTALRAQHTPVKMIWQQWGHSDFAPAPGEGDWHFPNPGDEYTTARIDAWFAKYLKGQSVSTGPNFAYFRDWTGTYATAPAYPVGSTQTWYLSGTALTTGLPQAGSQSFLTPVLGVPTSTGPIDALADAVISTPTVPEVDLPGTFASFTTAPLASPVNVAGTPTVRLRVATPTAALTQVTGPTGMLTLFLRIVDVAPDGTSATVRNLIAPIRVPDVSKPFTVTMPAFVHRFEAGHQIRLVVAGGSLNYRGGLLANAVTIATGSTAQSLSLPTVN